MVYVHLKSRWCFKLPNIRMINSVTHGQMETRNYNRRFACCIELISDYVIIVRMFFSILNVLETGCHLPWDYFAGLSSHVWPIEIPMQKTSSKFGESWKKNVDYLPVRCLVCLVMLTHSEQNINFITRLDFRSGSLSRSSKFLNIQFSHITHSLLST